MDVREARLLRAIAAELGARADADETTPLRLAETVLNRLASEIDIVPQIGARLLARYRDAVPKADAGLSPLQVRIEAASAVAQIADQPPSVEGDRAIAGIVQVERLRQAAINRTTIAPGCRPGRPAVSPSAQAPTRPEITAYLRRALDVPDLVVEALTLLTGGRSKRVMLIEQQGAPDLPARLILRQDPERKQTRTFLRGEVDVLKRLQGRGLPVARPLHFELDDNPLGRPFVLLDYLPGTMAGGLFAGFTGVNRQFAIDLATVIGRIHAVEITAREHGSDIRAGFLKRVVRYRKRWQQVRLEPSPLVESGYAWLLRQKDRSFGRPVIVHGDCGPHNLLKNDGLLSGIVDWEMTHIGDAGEDLGSLRRAVQQLLPWPEFIAHYRAAGGEDVDERRILMGAIWGHVRMLTIRAGAERVFHEGRSTDFRAAALAYLGPAKVESLLAPLLERAWQLEAEMQTG